MDQKMVDAAMKGLKARSGWPKKPHRCQEWVRLCAEQEFGTKFDDEFDETALLSARNFKGTKYEVPLENGSQPGDLLYKMTGSGGNGHVAIRILGNKVAENSSVHWDGRDARGVRTLKEFGNFDMIVRLK